MEQLRVAQECLHEIIPGGVRPCARVSSKFFKAMTPVIVRGHGARVEDASSSGCLTRIGAGGRSP